MNTKETTSTAGSAPAMVRDTTDREQVKALASVAAVGVPGDCEHCSGTGRSRTVARLHAAIDSADHIRWVDDPAGRDLVVVIDGEVHQFAVKRPEQAENAA